MYSYFSYNSYFWHFSLFFKRLLRRCDGGAQTTITLVPMGLWGPFVFRKHCHVELNKLISIQSQEFSTMTSQPLVKKQTALCTTSIPHNDDNSTARFIPFGQFPTELSINDGLSRRRSSRRFQEWSQCHVLWISYRFITFFVHISSRTTNGTL